MINTIQHKVKYYNSPQTECKVIQKDLITKEIPQEFDIEKRYLTLIFRVIFNLGQKLCLSYFS